MKKKYPIDKEFSSISWFKSPLSKIVFPFATAFLSLYKMKSDEDVESRPVKIKTFDDKFIKCYLVSPKEEKEQYPCLIYVHGGAFVFKAAPSHYRLAKQYAKESGCKVLFLDYRLSPKNKYPTALNDVYGAYEWVLNNSTALQINPKKICIAGDSAGGNLTACCLNKIASEKVLPMPSAQMLVYPATDARMLTKSMETFYDVPVWNSKLNVKMWKYYLDKEELKLLPTVSPVLQKSFVGYPPTYVETAEYDCLKDEALEYAEKLSLDGVKVFTYQTKGTIHGFDFIAKSSIVKKAVEERIAFLKEVFKD